jgi:general L-amino acid transport system permease protein
MAQQVALRPRRGPSARRRARPLGWLRAKLFSTWYNALLTVLAAWIVFATARTLYLWGWADAAFGTTPASCAGASGACWSVIGDFWQIFIVGLYPLDQRWRAFSALLLIALMLLLSTIGTLRRWRWFPLLWALLPIPVFVLVRGGVLGLVVVPTSQWGGLLITIGLASVGLAVGIPIGILLALGRQSERIPVIRSFCVVFIEVVRSVPFIMILIMGSIMLPMFLPSAWDVDLLLRAQIAVIMSAAANSAEIVRGGMASVGKGQLEAARSIGLGYWKMMGLVILPQALRVMIPVFVSMFIIFLKDTSLVVVIGLFDMLGAATLATGNPDWVGRNFETYLFVAAIYFVMCFSMSRYSRRLELKYRVR